MATPRFFYFDFLAEGQPDPDSEGTELTDLEEALKEATGGCDCFATAIKLGFSLFGISKIAEPIARDIAARCARRIALVTIDILP